MLKIGERIFIRLLSEDDVTGEYLNWLRDVEVIRFLESRWKTFTLEDLKQYVRNINNSHHDYIFGIFLLDTGKHIGNIKIGSINFIHRFGDIGLLIGDKNYWGKGYGTEAIKLATGYAFEDLNLRCLIAGMYSNNVGSYKAFLKAGYEQVGVYKKKALFNGSYVDEIIMQKLKED